MTLKLSEAYRVFTAGDDKSPLIKGWQDRATRDPYMISQWQGNGARAWGIPTGVSNDLFVVDLDTDDDTGEAVGEASLLALPRYARLEGRMVFSPRTSKVDIRTLMDGLARAAFGVAKWWDLEEFERAAIRLLNDVDGQGPHLVGYLGPRIPQSDSAADTLRQRAENLRAQWSGMTDEQKQACPDFEPAVSSR